MADVPWPAVLPAPRASDWYLDGGSVAGPQAIDGRTSAVRAENRIWRCRYEVPRLAPRATFALRAMIDALSGRAGVLELPLCSEGLPDWGRPGAPCAAVTYAGGVTMRADTPAGASIVRLSGAASRFLMPGGLMTIMGSLYRLQRREAGGGLRINPSLRAAVPAGQPVEIERPRVRVHLDVDGLAVPLVLRRRSERVTLPLVEAFGA